MDSLFHGKKILTIFNSLAIINPNIGLIFFWIDKLIFKKKKKEKKNNV